MTRRLPWISALVATLYVTSSLWVERTGGSSTHLRDLVGSMVVAAATVGIGWWLGGRLTSEPSRRGIIALVVGLWGPLGASIQVLLVIGVHRAFESSLAATGAWSVLCAAAIWVIARGRTPLIFATRLLAFASAFLLVSQAVRFVNIRTAPMPTPVNRAAPGSPSVYLIVLDKYSSGRWLAQTYGVDHSAFEDSLRALGFAVPSRARANYSHTHLSLASFLNWRYLDSESDAVGGPPWGQTRDLIRDARTWREFRARGYPLITFPTWYTGTNGIESADLTLHWPRPRPARFAETWILNSPVAALFSRRCAPPACRPSGITPYPVETLEELQWKLNTFAGLADSAGPVLGFLHLLLPHEPYLFADDCARRDPWWPKTDQGESFEAVGKAYATQVRCTTPMILAALRAIVARSAVPPIILVQSDHGHARIFTDLLRGFTLEYDAASREQVGERLGVFAAYRFPGADTLVADDISAVNVLRLVARVLWQDSTPPLPDRSYWSSYQNGFRFTEVPATMTRPPDRP